MGTRVELKESSLVWQVEQLAEQTAQPVEDVLATAVETYLDQLEREGIHAETQAFWSMQTQLASEYAEQHVAIYKGKVVDHDVDVALLERRIRARFGVLPVLIAPVKPEGRHELRDEYDLSQLPILPKGRYAPGRRLGRNLVVLEPDIARAFPSDEAVNHALHLLLQAVQIPERIATT
jgi:hypothetical protein